MPSNFITSLGVACKDNPQIFINRLDSSAGNTPTDTSPFHNNLANRGQNTSGHTIALPSNMTFGDLSPDDAEIVSPGTKRARAHTFNIDDGLVITKYPCETESNQNNPASVEERKDTGRSDPNKNLTSGQEKFFNTKTPISQFDSTTDSSHR